MILGNFPHEDPVENLLKQWNGLIWKLARSLCLKLKGMQPTIDEDDLYQIGCIKFLDLARHEVNFDPSSSYYQRAIYFGMIGGLRISLKPADFLRIGIDEFEEETGRDFFDVYGHKIIKDDDGSDSEGEVIQADLHGRLRRVIGGLKKRDQRILNSFLDGMSMSDIAQTENLSTEGVSQIIERVQKKAAKVCGVVLKTEQQEGSRKILQGDINRLVFRIYQESAGEPIDYKARVKERLIKNGYSFDDKEFRKVDKLVEEAIASVRRNGYSIQAIDVQ